MTNTPAAVGGRMPGDEVLLGQIMYCFGFGERLNLTGCIRCERREDGRDGLHY